MSRDPRSLQAELRAGALWRDGTQDAQPDRAAWPVRILLGASAWLAACLLLPLIGVLLADVIDLESWAGFAAAGACCALAAPLLRSRGSGFLRQLGSALSLAGLMLAAWQAVSLEGAGWLGLGVLAGVMYLIGSGLFIRDPVWRDPVHPFLCAVMMAVALILAIDQPTAFRLSGVPMVVLAAVALCIWGAQLPVAAHPWWQAVDQLAWAFFLVGVALAFVTGSPSFRGDEAFSGAIALHHTVPAGLCALAPTIVWWWASGRVGECDHRSWMVQRGLGSLALLALWPIWNSIPGAALGLCAVLLGFALFRVLVLAVGAAALLAHLAAYYYQTHTTLLQKSFGLFVAGMGLLGVALLAGAWQRRSR